MAKDNSLIPKNLGSMTLSDLMEADDAKLEKKGNQWKISRKSKNHVISVVIKEYDNGHMISAADFNSPHYKRDLAKEAKDLRQDGYTYREIGDMLGMSDTWARHLCKEG